MSRRKAHVAQDVLCHRIGVQYQILFTYSIRSAAANAKDLDNAGTKTAIGHEGGDGTALFHAATEVAGFSADAEEGTILSVSARSFIIALHI